MRYQWLASLVLVCLSGLLLCGCSTFWEQDNRPRPKPLAQLNPSLKIQTVWDNRTGYGVGRDYLKLSPLLTANSVITIDHLGTITAVDKLNGRTQWKSFLNTDVTSSPAVNGDLLVFGTKNGTVVALNLADRKPRWQTQVDSEILAQPAISDKVVLIKSVDGKLTALSTQDGHKIWTYRQTEPNLILRGASAPQIYHDAVIVGSAGGKLSKLSLADGKEDWSELVSLPHGAFSIEHMVDVDADPIIDQNRIFVGLYQGKVTALDLSTGKPVWEQAISTYSGIAVDKKQVYVADSKGHIWGLNRQTGKVLWEQTQLEARDLTGPVVSGDHLVVGDNQGFLHWLSKKDGHFLGRAQVGETGILANPVAQDKVVYAVTRSGYVAAYTYS